jgi:Kef-type K+ transport system membrane component KefB
MWYIAPSTGRLVTALIIGTALSISALPVIARILRDLDLLTSDVGAVVMSAATLDDIIGWSAFAMVLSCMAGRAAGVSALMPIVVVPILLVLVLIGGPRLAGRCPGLVKVLLSVWLLSALTEWLGLGGAFGAFLAGVVFAPRGAADDGHSEPDWESSAPMIAALNLLADKVFAPLYFASVGLAADFGRGFDLRLVLFTLLIATIGKVAGAWLGGRIAGAPSREALAVAFGLNARGAMGIILATAALDRGVIAPTVFVTIVAMSLITSLISGPAMRQLTRKAAG